MNYLCEDDGLWYALAHSTHSADPSAENVENIDKVPLKSLYDYPRKMDVCLEFLTAAQISRLMCAYARCGEFACVMELINNGHVILSRLFSDAIMSGKDVPDELMSIYKHDPNKIMSSYGTVYREIEALRSPYNLVPDFALVRMGKMVEKTKDPQKLLISAILGGHIELFEQITKHFGLVDFNLSVIFAAYYSENEYFINRTDQKIDYLMIRLMLVRYNKMKTYYKYFGTEPAHRCFLPYAARWGNIKLLNAIRALNLSNIYMRILFPYAMKYGQVKVLKWARLHGYTYEKLPHDVIPNDYDKYLRKSDKYDGIGRLMSLLVKNGKASAFRWLFKNVRVKEGCEQNAYYQSVQYTFAHKKFQIDRNAEMRTVQFMKKLNFISDKSAFEWAMQNSHFSLARKFYDKSFSKTWHVEERATVKFVQWLYDRNLLKKGKHISYACSLEVLKWAHKHKMLNMPGLIEYAASKNRIDVFRWLLSIGQTCDVEEVIQRAIYEDLPAFVKFLIKEFNVGRVVLHRSPSVVIMNILHENSCYPIICV